MGDWSSLPQELLAHIYTFLPRRERLACSLVCKNWRLALDNVFLWRKMTVYIDKDLNEPSTVLLLRDYCGYLRSLEFGWTLTHRHFNWPLSSYHHEMTKRAVRFFLILYDNYVQINRLKIFNWKDFVTFQKIAYHLSRFLKIQMSLKQIILDDMSTANCVRILSSCLHTNKNIAHLDLHTCFHCQTNFDSVFFRSSLEQFSNLRVLLLDYFMLSCQVIDAILTSKNRVLEKLEVWIKEAAWYGHVITKEQWRQLCTACPKINVSFIITNVYHHDELKIFLKEGIPLVSFCLFLPKIYEKSRRYNYTKTLITLIYNYHKTLVTVDLIFNNENETLDDIIMTIIKSCARLERLTFQGFIDNPLVFKSLGPDPTYQLVEKNNFNKSLSTEELSNLRYKRAKLKVLKDANGIACSLFIYN